MRMKTIRDICLGLWRHFYKRLNEMKLLREAFEWSLYMCAAGRKGMDVGNDILRVWHRDVLRGMTTEFPAGCVCMVRLAAAHPHGC